MPHFRPFHFYRRKLSRLLYVFLTVCCSLLYNLSFAQHREIDSLNKLLPTLHETARINCLNKLSEYYCNYNKAIRYYARTDSAELCINKAYSEAEKINYKLGEGNAFLNLSKIYLRRWNYYAGQRYAEQAISVFKNIGAQGELAQAYSILVDAFWDECDNNSARKYAEMLLDYYKKNKEVCWYAAKIKSRRNLTIRASQNLTFAN